MQTYLITSDQNVQKYEDQKYVFQGKRSKHVVRVHTASFHQLHYVLLINSFSSLGIDWVYLPAFLDRAWNQKKAWHFIYLVIYLLYRSLASIHSLQRFCLSFFLTSYLHFKHKDTASDISTEEPEPVVSLFCAMIPLRTWWGREEGYYQNIKHFWLPASFPVSLASGK